MNLDIDNIDDFKKYIKDLNFDSLNEIYHALDGTRYPDRLAVVEKAINEYPKSSNNVIKLPIAFILIEAFKLLVKSSKNLTKSLLVTFFILITVSVLSEKYFVESDFLTFSVIYIIHTMAFTLLAITCHRTFILGPDAVPIFGELQSNDPRHP